MQVVHRTGRFPVGLKGTLVGLLHSSQSTSCTSNSLPCRLARSVIRHSGHRLGVFSNPFCAKKYLSLAANTKSLLQSLQFNVVSSYIARRVPSWPAFYLINWEEPNVHAGQLTGCYLFHEPSFA